MKRMCYLLLASTFLLGTKFEPAAAKSVTYQELSCSASRMTSDVQDVNQDGQNDFLVLSGVAGVVLARQIISQKESGWRNSISLRQEMLS